jgi:hypothetical protein
MRHGVTTATAGMLQEEQVVAPAEIIVKDCE